MEALAPLVENEEFFVEHVEVGVIQQVSQRIGANLLIDAQDVEAVLVLCWCALEGSWEVN